MRSTASLVILIILSFWVPGFFSSCAQIGAPTGGPKDSIAPVVVRTNPPNKSVNFDGKTITLTMDEYVELQNTGENVMISPLPKKQPYINYNLKTVTVKLKDSLLPNTTYTIDFGNAIKDAHEGNVLKNLRFSFSTGDHIDSLKLKGKILLAETNKPDSTIFAYLYRNTNDTAFQKLRPDYVARTNGKGEFEFVNLPNEAFRVYALKDGDGSKTYNSKTEFLAFIDDIVYPSLKDSVPVLLNAFAVENPDETRTTSKSAPDKKLRLTTNLSSGKQDLLEPLTISFNNPLKPFDSSIIKLTDTSFRKIPGYTIKVDSTRSQFTISNTWKPESPYILVVPKEGIEDSTGLTRNNSDTIRFQTKNEYDYGRVVLRFSNLDLNRHPVIQFTEADNVKFAFPVTSKEFTNKRFPPGEFGIRILYDENQNGVWDTGNYEEKRQPESVIALDMKLQVRADWDNEREIKL